VAKAAIKSSTPSPPPGSVSLKAHFERLQRESQQALTALLQSSETEVHPPLPSGWRVEVSFTLVTSDGKPLDPAEVFLRKRVENPFKPISPPAAVIAALYAGKEPPLPPLQPVTAQEAAAHGPKQWLVYVPDRFPETAGETRAKYFKRVAKHMRKELGEEAWEASYIENKMYELGLLSPRQQRTKNSHKTPTKLPQKSHRFKS
jgi:hypothetical protein